MNESYVIAFSLPMSIDTDTAELRMLFLDSGAVPDSISRDQCRLIPRYASTHTVATRLAEHATNTLLDGYTPV